MNLDLTAISWVQVLEIAAACAVVDTLFGIVTAIKDGTFSLADVATFLESHVLTRIFPIVGLDFLAQTLPQPAGAAVFAIAVGGLTAYVLETVQSVGANAQAPVVVAGSPAA